MKRHPPEPSPPVDTMLRAARWTISDARHPIGDRPEAMRGLRIGRRVPDYALFANRRMIGFVEVKARSTPVELLEQQARSLAEEFVLHATGKPGFFPGFIYLLTDSETFFLSGRADSPPRVVAGFHRPETLLTWADQSPFAAQVSQMPAVVSDRLRPYQADALRALEASLAGGDRRALMEIPTGAGSLAIAIGESYRLLRHTDTHRILYLVDRRVAAEQALAAFRDFETTEGRFGDLYPVHMADSPHLSPAAGVLILTIQRLHGLMRGDQDALEEEGDVGEHGNLAHPPEIPIDCFDFIWWQEPRSLLAASGRLLDYFDAPIVGLASTPSRESSAYFDGNVVVKLDPVDIEQHASRPRSAATRVPAARPPVPDLPIPAPFLLDFLQRYLRDREANLLVDPTVLNPILPAALLEVNAARDALGLLPSAELANFARASHPDPRIEWLQQSPPKAGGELFLRIGSPDLIVSFPPLGLHRAEAFLSTPGGRVVKLNDDVGYRVLLKASAQLTPDGEAIFLVGNDFLFRSQPTRARAVLEKLALHVHAVIAVEKGISDRSVPLNLIFVGRSRPATTFVGKLSPQVNTDQLVSHLKRRRRGTEPELGRLVRWESFQGYAQLAAEERVASLIAEAGLDTVPLTELLAEPLRAPPRRGEDFQPRENAVYLSIFPAGAVHTRREQLTGKPENYIQLVFDPRHASAEYVALTLNAPLGRALRETIAAGQVMSRISLKHLAQLQLPLPELSVQRQVSRAHGQIGGLRLELEGLERQLASDPRSAAQVAKALAEIGQRDPLTTFRETLPFPLASILWRYQADADVKAKIDHLHRFFEASAIYLVAVLLSAFLADEELFDEERQVWLKQLAPNSFRRSSFGTWTFFGGQLAGSARRRLQGSEADRERMHTAFAVEAPQFLAAVSAAGLWRLLDEAKQERNRSKAHGGILGRSEQDDIHLLLGNLLTQLGGILAEPMAEVRLVRPGAARFRAGVGHYERAELLQGENNIFQQTTLSAFVQMDADELYLIPAGSRTAQNALHITPLFRLQTSPRGAENACYFYSGLTDADRAEFISHHFEAQPHITLHDPELLALLARLGKPDP